MANVDDNALSKMLERLEQQMTKKQVKPTTKAESKLIRSGAEIHTNSPGQDDLTFMHSVMCQVGFPRSKVAELEFERTCGGAGLYLRAGKLWDGTKFVQQGLPYGPLPRLVMAYLNTKALRSASPEIEVGDSASSFMHSIGKGSTGGKTGSYTAFKKQMLALSACSITLGFTAGNTAITYDGKPIQRFEAWMSDTGQQSTFWPGVITFSQEYFQTLKSHAVPLDLRALNALSGSAFAMDVYVMLAERLHRINGRPVILHWKSLRQQFGQEFTGRNPDKDFKKKFQPALKKALTVYPKARVKQVTGGIMMLSSPPPIPYKN